MNVLDRLQQVATGRITDPETCQAILRNARQLCERQGAEIAKATAANNELWEAIHQATERFAFGEVTPHH